MTERKIARIAMVTGITGQDGSYLAELLLGKNYQVVGFGQRNSILAAQHLAQLQDRLSFAYGDLADAASITAAIQEHRPDEIYNLAAQSTPAASWDQAVETGEITGLGAHRVFEAVRLVKPDCRIFQASSSEMFGEPAQSPQDERTPLNPLNPYAAAKVYAHQLARIYRRGHGMFVACGILFNHESPRRGMQFLPQKVAYGAACAGLGLRNSAALNEIGEPIVKDGRLSVGNLDSARDWGSARDYVDAMWRMLQQPRPDDYAIGTGHLRSVGELCEAAYRSVGLDWRDHVASDPRFARPVDTAPTVANPAKARDQLGWAPKMSFQDMIDGMVDAHRARLAKGDTDGH